MNILYIEDDKIIGEAVKIFLKKKGYNVLIAQSVWEAKKRLTVQKPMLCLVDWNLPDDTGMALCQWIRKHDKQIPIMFITVKDQSEHIIEGLQSGADDYIIKPFDLNVLYARIQAMLRRSGTFDDTKLTCGRIDVDRQSCQVWVDKEEISLSANEYRLLEMLIVNKNRTLTRAQLLTALWDENGSYVNDNTLTVTVKRLREKLNCFGSIKTIRSFGYRMEDT